MTCYLLGSFRGRLAAASGVALGALLLLPGVASAHIDLVEPAARVAGGFSGTQKSAPCGDGDGAGRTDDSIHEFAPGEEITIKIDEAIDHPSYYRVAFSEDGEDFPVRDDINDIVDQESDDPEANLPVDGLTILGYHYEEPNASSYEFTVTLPNIECENCTLQVTQFMYNNNSNYFQCADIALRGDGVEPVEDGAGGSGAVDDTEAGGAGSGDGMGDDEVGGANATGDLVAAGGASTAAAGSGSDAVDVIGAGGGSGGNDSGDMPITDEPLPPAGAGGAAAQSGVAGGPATTIDTTTGSTDTTTVGSTTVGSTAGASAAGATAGATGTATAGMAPAGTAGAGTAAAGSSAFAAGGPMSGLSSSDDDGCAVTSVSRNSSSFGLWALLLVALVGLQRRRSA